MKKNNENYACGIENEKKVARKYKRAGATEVIQSPGSRGSYDLEIKKPTRKTHLVQVKSTCADNGKAKKVTEKEKTALINKADAKKAIAVIAYVDSKGRSELRYAKNNRKVKP